VNCDLRPAWGKNEKPYLNINEIKNRTGGVAKVIELQHSKSEVLGSSTTQSKIKISQMRSFSNSI
jgi:hypothetical protein